MLLTASILTMLLHLIAQPQSIAAHAAAVPEFRACPGAAPAIADTRRPFPPCGPISRKPLPAPNSLRSDGKPASLRSD